MERQETEKLKSPSRRAALRRLAGAAVVGYVVPEVLFLSAARAESSTVSDPTIPSEPSVPAPSESSVVSTPSAPAPSGGTVSTASSASSAEEGARETCSVTGSQNADNLRISRGDLQRAQEAIEAGNAQPLDQIWGVFRSEYDGRVIGVEFLNRRNNPRYRFRAISKSGRLETVTISAQTGSVQKVVGC